MSCRAYLTILAILAASSAGGCGNKAIRTREQATAAALARYPGDPQQSDEIRLAAVDHAKDKKVEILNLTDRSIESPTIWVNQTFLNRTRTIPPRGQVTVKYSELLEQGGGVRDLDMVNVPVKTVEVETAQGLFSVTGTSRK
jgi:hypothetical protein